MNHRTCDELPKTPSDTLYIKTNGTATSDRVCASHEVCAADQWETERATTSSDRVCQAHRVCSATEWEVTAPSAGGCAVDDRPARTSRRAHMRIVTCKDS